VKVFGLAFTPNATGRPVSNSRQSRLLLAAPSSEQAGKCTLGRFLGHAMLQRGRVDVAKCRIQEKGTRWHSRRPWRHSTEVRWRVACLAARKRLPAQEAVQHVGRRCDRKTPA